MVTVGQRVAFYLDRMLVAKGTVTARTVAYDTKKFSTELVVRQNKNKTTRIEIQQPTSRRR